MVYPFAMSGLLNACVLFSFHSDTSYVDFSWSGDPKVCLKVNPQLE